MLTAPPLAAVGVPHGFTDASLDVAVRAGAAPASIASGRGVAMRAAGTPGATWVSARQVHGDAILDVHRHSALEQPADALVTQDERTRIAVFSADCVPVLLASKDGRVVAAVHGGWRGTALRITAKVVAHLEERGVPARDLVTAIGPCIGPCCYEVGDDVATALRTSCGPGSVVRDGTHADLVHAHHAMLVASGVPAEQVWRAGICTHCDASYGSYRRDGAAAGRQAALIGPRLS